MLSNEHAVEKLSEDEIAAEVRVLTYRHLAWMTALRHAMRAARPWETTSRHKTNREWDIQPPEWDANLEEELRVYLSEADLTDVMAKNNKQTALLYQQSHHLKKLQMSGVLWEFSFLELEAVLQELFNLQGKSERIKNFPYPRQYATLNHYFMWVFVLLLPLALVPQFAELGNTLAAQYPSIGPHFVWFSVPLFVAVAWVFHTMERIGRTGDNPFEGTSNDVPISTIARGIEIDLRQNLGDAPEVIPGPLPVVRNTQW
jgi:putative membrane protein